MFKLGLKFGIILLVFFKNMSLLLNMIVKNESNVILPLLRSVSKLIDTYCICDTGSTDDTIDIITTFFNSIDIPGIILYFTVRKIVASKITIKYIILKHSKISST